MVLLQREIGGAGVRGRRGQGVGEGCGEGGRGAGGGRPEDVVVVGEEGEEDAEEEADGCGWRGLVVGRWLRGRGVRDVRPMMRKVAKGEVPLAGMMAAGGWW